MHVKNFNMRVFALIDEICYKIHIRRKMLYLRYNSRNAILQMRYLDIYIKDLPVTISSLKLLKKPNIAKSDFNDLYLLW